MQAKREIGQNHIHAGWARALRFILESAGRVLLTLNHKLASGPNGGPHGIGASLASEIGAVQMVAAF